MSRSRHNKSGKAPDTDYWQRRPGNKGGACPGKYGGKETKTLTHRIERRNAKRMEEER